MWGYELVECGSVGFLGRKDPYGRSSTKDGGGTLTAVFRRVEMRERAIPALPPLSTASPVVPPLSLLSSSSPPPHQHQHKLIATHNHPVHPLSGKPSSPSTILSSIRTTFSTSPEDELSIDDLWLSNGLDAACGGMTKALIDALLLPPSSDSDSQSTTTSLDIETNTITTVPPKLEWELTQGNPADILTWLVKWTKWTPPSTSSSLTAFTSRPYAAWRSDSGTDWEDDDDENEEYISLAQARLEMDNEDEDRGSVGWTLQGSEMETLSMSKAGDLWASWGDSAEEVGGGGWDSSTPTGANDLENWGGESQNSFDRSGGGGWGESSPLGIANPTKHLVPVEGGDEEV